MVSKSRAVEQKILLLLCLLLFLLLLILAALPPLLFICPQHDPQLLLRATGDGTDAFVNELPMQACEP
jgi:hypothetical protein